MEITNFIESAFWVLYVVWTLSLVCLAFSFSPGESMEDENEESEFDLSDEVFEEEEILTIDDVYREYGHTRGDF